MSPVRGYWPIVVVVLAACAPRVASPPQASCPPTKNESTELVIDQAPPAARSALVAKPSVECPVGSTWNGVVCEGVLACPLGTTAQPDGVCRGRVEMVVSMTMGAPPRESHERTWGAPREAASTFACAGQSIETCRAQCFLGSGPSCNTLGETYRDARDPGAAILAFVEGCIARDARACANIGRAYARGDGIEKDAIAAAKWLGIACNAGDLQACR